MSQPSAQVPASPDSLPKTRSVLSNVAADWGHSVGSPSMLGGVVRCAAVIFGPDRVLADWPLLLVGSTFVGRVEPYQASPPKTTATTASTIVMISPHRRFGVGGLT